MRLFWWIEATRQRGERQVLGVSVSLSEHETHWKAFQHGLKDHGMKGVQVSDQRRSCRFGSGQKSGFRQCPVAALPVSPEQNAGLEVPK